MPTGLFNLDGGLFTDNGVGLFGSEFGLFGGDFFAPNPESLITTDSDILLITDDNDYLATG